MTLHDAAISKFSQWWKRSIRGGWAVAEGVSMHGASPEKYMIRQSRSGWVWGCGFPLVALSSTLLAKGVSLVLFMAYPLLAWRIYRWRRHNYGDETSEALLYSFFCILSKPAQAWGQSKYWLLRWQKKSPKLIEYKSK
jgi:hypothetical protein